jgi:hypothetical protein
VLPVRSVDWDVLCNILIFNFCISCMNSTRTIEYLSASNVVHRIIATNPRCGIASTFEPLCDLRVRPSEYSISIQSHFSVLEKYSF